MARAKESDTVLWGYKVINLTLKVSWSSWPPGLAPPSAIVELSRGCSSKPLMLVGGRTHVLPPTPRSTD